MTRSALRFLVPLMLCFVPLVLDGQNSLEQWAKPQKKGTFSRLVPPSGQERRSFEPGGPESLIMAGAVNYTKIETEVVVMSMEWSSSGAPKMDKRTDTLDVKFYEVYLFVDEAGVRGALQPFAGQEFRLLHGEGKVQQAVLKGAFPKLLLLRFTEPQKGREVREDMATELRKYPGGSGGEAGRFVSFLRKDFAAGDEVEIRIVPGGAVRTTVRGEAQREIVSPEFADALLSVWLLQAEGGGKHSAFRRLEAEEVVRNLRPFVPPKPGS